MNDIKRKLKFNNNILGPITSLNQLPIRTSFCMNDIIEFKELTGYCDDEIITRLTMYNVIGINNLVEINLLIKVGHCN